MKKPILLVLTIITMLFCVWSAIESSAKLNLQTADVRAIGEKNILQNAKISDCEKKILIQKLEFSENRKQEISNNAFSEIKIFAVIFVIQLVLFFGIVLKK